jgi:hypothetical protein
LEVSDTGSVVDNLFVLGGLSLLGQSWLGHFSLNSHSRVLPAEGKQGIYKANGLTIAYLAGGYEEAFFGRAQPGPPPRGRGHMGKRPRQDDEQQEPEKEKEGEATDWNENEVPCSRDPSSDSLCAVVAATLRG